MSRFSPSAPLRVAALMATTATVACVQTSRHAEAAVLKCDDLGGLLAAYQTVHYTVRRVDDEVKRRTVHQFVVGLDPSRTLLLDSEAQALEAKMLATFDTTRRGECGVLADAQKLIEKRAAGDTVRVKKVVGAEKYAVDASVELVLDPEKRGYPKTDAEREALAVDLIHFQMASYLRSGIDLAKAKKQLTHRYELTEKRIKERSSQGRLPEMFAESFAHALDPHTSFLSFDALMDFQINMKLSLEGIGAALRSQDGFTYIESLIPGGGAEKSGKLRPKDKIIAVTQHGGEPVTTIDMALRDVVKLIRGKKGTKVTLTVLREAAETKTLDVTIVRDKIDVEQQAAKLEIEERKLGEEKVKVGVLELPSFYGSGRDGEGRSSYEDVKRLLGKARKEGASALVLDLSKNGGGYLEDAVRISGLFLAEGAVVATRDTDGEESVLRDRNDDTEWAGPLVVLVSPMSASASEILAGALKSYRRAVVVGAGKSSFGKGSVQTMRPLPRNLGAMKVTTGMYFLPSGNSTQQVGVDVDIVVPSLLSTIEMGEKDLDYSLAPQSMRPFRSDDVNGEGDDHWVPVTAIAIDELSARSKARIAANEAFREVETEIAKAKEKKESIKLSDYLEEKEDSDEDEGDEEDGEPSRFERLEELFEDEAVDVAVDLAFRASGRKLSSAEPARTNSRQSGRP